MEEIEEVIEDVMRENYYEDYIDQAVGSLVREFNSRIKLGTFTEIDGEEVKKVKAGKTRDFWILQFYTSIRSEDERGTMGYGYAYNLENPNLSEWGNLYTPNGGN